MAITDALIASVDQGGGSRAQELVRRARFAFERRDRMKALYRKAQQLGQPNRDGWDSPADGKETQVDVVDSTFQAACNRLANTLMEKWVPKDSRWVGFGPGSQIEKESHDDVRQRLIPMAETTSDLLTQGGFYRAAQPFFSDLIFGTGALQTDDDWENVCRIQCVPIHELGAEEGPRSMVDAIFREYSVQGRRLKEFLGDKLRLPSGLESQLSGSPDTPQKLLSCVVPETRGPKRYVQTVYWAGSWRDPLLEREFSSNPMAVSRWGVLPGEVFGRGPALEAACTAASLNELSTLILAATSIAAYGMWTSSSSEVNSDTVQFQPGGIIQVGSGGNDNSNPTLRPLQTSGNMDWGEWVQRDLRSQIQKSLFRDNLSGVDDRSKMTLGEVLERQAMVMSDMSAGYNRTNDEGIGRCVARVVELGARHGKLPQMVRIDNKLVKMEYLSPLARAQSQEAINALRSLAQEVRQDAAVNPAVLARWDEGAYYRRLAALTGVDAEGILRDDEETNDRLSQAAAMVQQAQGQEMAA